jgi:hypothetical protein
VNLAPGRKPDPQHHREVHRKDRIIHHTRMNPEHAAPPESANYKNGPLRRIVTNRVPSQNRDIGNRSFGNRSFR